MIHLHLTAFYHSGMLVLTCKHASVAGSSQRELQYAFSPAHGMLRQKDNSAWWTAKQLGAREAKAAAPVHDALRDRKPSNLLREKKSVNVTKNEKNGSYLVLSTPARNPEMEHTVFESPAPSGGYRFAKRRWNPARRLSARCLSTDTLLPLLLLQFGSPQSRR
jgi:hypothetical protein